MGVCEYRLLSTFFLYIRVLELVVVMSFVLPLLESEFVPTGWVGEEAFLAGYGARISTVHKNKPSTFKRNLFKMLGYYNIYQNS